MRLAVASNAFLVVVVLALASACGPATPVAELAHYPLDSADGVLTRDGVELDRGTSKDGKGSLRIVASKPTTVRLFETGPIASDKSRLTYHAALRTENLEGRAYLEMWAVFDGKGEFFSRALQSPLSGTTDWTAQETPFFLQKGERPSSLKLNLVIEGKGTVWIDDVRLIQGPLG